MGIFDKFKGLFVETVEEDEEEVQPTPTLHKQPETSTKKIIANQGSSHGFGSNVVNIPFSPSQVKMVIVEPTKFDDVQRIADCLRNDEPVIINFEKADHDVVQRITDFISGTLYALGGTAQSVGQDILLCATKAVDISSSGLSAGFTRRTDSPDFTKEFAPWKDNK